MTMPKHNYLLEAMQLANKVYDTHDASKLLMTHVHTTQQV